MTPAGRVRATGNRKVKGRSFRPLRCVRCRPPLGREHLVTPRCLAWYWVLPAHATIWSEGSSPCHKATPAENVCASGVVIGSRAGVGDRAGPHRREQLEEHSGAAGGGHDVERPVAGELVAPDPAGAAVHLAIGDPADDDVVEIGRASCRERVSVVV